MKKITIILLLIGIASFSSAQELKIMWFGGSASFQSIKTKGQEADTEVTFMPEFGYNLNNKFALGITGGYGRKNVNDDVYSYSGNNYINIAPFVRYTALRKDKFNLYLDGIVSYKDYVNQGNGFNGSENSLAIGFKPGIAFVLSNRMSLTTQLGIFGYSKVKSGSTNNSLWQFSAGASNLAFGINIHI